MSFEQIQETADWITSKTDGVPDIAMILGSGLGALADDLDDAQVIPYREIPNFPVSNVEGHAGNLVFGTMEGKRVAIMQGRSHYYEGWSGAELTFPIRVFKTLGTNSLLVTNSAGGINRDFKPGDLMLITDHINMMGFNPLRGENEEKFGPRFPDMTAAYDPEVRNVIIQAARDLNIAIKSGVYAAVAGPSYETPAEVRMIGVCGGDAVGMSTVPEVIIANHMGMRVGGISCISNLAAGISAQKLDHAEVKATANMVREKFGQLVKKTVALL